MSKSINVSLSQVETIFQEGYQTALNDLYSLGILDKPVNRKPEVIKEMESKVTSCSKATFDRYFNCAQDGLRKG